MPFSLFQLSEPELQGLAKSQIPSNLVSRLEEDALPPPFVAARSLEMAAAGHLQPWSTTFLIVRSRDNRIVGNCGFKTGLENGRVEVGYGVAPSAQGQGAATEALRMLLTKAFEVGATEVLAEVIPQNLASVRVVEKVGFKRAGSRTNENNEYVIQWLRQSET